MAVSSCSGSPYRTSPQGWADPEPLCCCPPTSNPAVPPHLCPRSSSSVTVTPACRNTSFPSLSDWRSIWKFWKKKKGEKSFPSEQSQQEPSACPSEKNWFCVTLKDWGTTQCSRQRQQATPSITQTLPSSMLFPGLQTCLSMHPHLGSLWEVKAGRQFDCHSLRQISAKRSPELTFLNCFLYCHQNVLFKSCQGFKS